VGPKKRDQDKLGSYDSWSFAGSVLNHALEDFQTGAREHFYRDILNRATNEYNRAKEHTHTARQALMDALAKEEMCRELQATALRVECNAPCIRCGVLYREHVALGGKCMFDAGEYAVDDSKLR
jgi:hypothetical protein